MSEATLDEGRRMGEAPGKLEFLKNENRRRPQGFTRAVWMHWLAQELIVSGMASYPKPKQPFWNFNRKCSMVKPHSDRPILSNLLEME